jgi:hypothetical protein
VGAMPVVSFLYLYKCSEEPFLLASFLGEDSTLPPMPPGVRRARVLSACLIPTDPNRR